MHKIYQYQIWHFLSAVVLVYACYYIIGQDASYMTGDLWGLDTSVWLVLALISPIAHQIYVWAIWRYELYQQTFSKKYGTDLAFKMFKNGFTPLIGSRLITITLLAFANQQTMDLPYSLWIGLFLFLPAGFLGFSVMHYFGIDRAYGIDHFKPEEARSFTMVKKGIFRFTSNGMYVFGFMGLYIPGLLLNSRAAILLAVFNHIFIWAHYYFTEKPDMERIYG